MNDSILIESLAPIAINLFISLLAAYCGKNFVYVKNVELILVVYTLKW